MEGRSHTYREKCLRRYRDYRLAGVILNARFWEDVCWEAVRAVGPEDAEHWLREHAALFEHPLFERDPVPSNCDWDAVQKRMSAKNASVLGHVWVSPHPEAYHKLGWYQVWGPTGLLGEIFGEREALAKIKGE